MTDSCLGKAILQYLNDNGITQVFLSRNSGIAPSKLCQSLHGNRNLTLDEYSLICGVLGVNTDKFLKPRIPEKKDRCN